MPPWHWHPSAVLGLAGLVALYLAGIGPLGRRFGWRPAAARSVRPGWFLAGVLAAALALLGPLAEWAEHVSLSAHMAQHLLLTLVVPPLWLAGTPAWLLRPLLRVPGVARAGHALTRPVAALGLASTALIAWHVPAFYDAALDHPALHVAEHLTLLGTALLGWWPVVGPLPEWPRPAPPGQLLYLFLATIPMTAAAAPITLADRVLYRFYREAPAAWPLGPAADQELAGVLMWMGGTVAYLLAGTAVYFRWATREGGEGAPLPEPR